MPTDVAGYRAESDAPPSDVTLASVLTNKAPLLNTPGSDVAEPLYYGKSNSSVNAAESQFYFGKDRIDFVGKSLTSQQNCYIPNRYMAGNCYLNVQLKGKELTWINDVRGGGRRPYFCMEQGWGFSIIGRLMYYLGASNVVNVAISGETNLALALCACETQEKRLQLLDMAGKWIFSRLSGSLNNGAIAAITGNSVGGSMIASPSQNKLLFRSNTNVSIDGTYGARVGNIVDDRLLHALVPLRLPWASTNALQGRLPFDTNLLNQPINVQIQFRPPPIRTLAEFFTSNPFTAMQGDADQLNLQYEQTELIDKSLSLRTELLQNPDFNVGLPFQFLQSMPFQAPYQQFTTEAMTVIATNSKVNITSMMNSDLTTIILQLQEPVNAGNGGNKADFVELNDIVLELNGQQFCVYQVDNYYSAQATRQLGAVSLQHPVMLRNNVDPAANQDWNADGYNYGAACITKDIGIYEINMSRLRSLANESHLVNTPRFTNQTFQISFTIPPSVNSQCYNYSAPQRSTVQNYTAHLTYCYNGVFQVGGGGGASKLFT